MSILERMFWGKVEWSEGCWRWLGFRNQGYGEFGGTTAHRIAYMLAVGDIPAGYVIDHLCANKLCVNPAHLEPVTIATNIKRYHWGAGRNVQNLPKPKSKHQRQAGRALACPECGAGPVQTLDSRPAGNDIRRRRVCRNGHRYTTYETVRAA